MNAYNRVQNNPIPLPTTTSQFQTDEVAAACSQFEAENKEMKDQIKAIQAQASDELVKQRVEF